MKRIIAIVLACIMASSLICIGVSATAANKAENKITEQMTTEEIAHLDLASADKETKEAILAARNEIIFSHEWVADGYSMEVVDSEGNVKRTIPKFSELFPGWDLPKATKNSTPTTLPMKTEKSTYDLLSKRDTTKNQSSDLNEWLPFAGGDVYLHEATNENADNFHEFYTDLSTIGRSVGTYVTQLTSSETCNIGYSDLLTDESIGFAENLSLGDMAVINNVGDMYLGVRASTYSNPGWAYFDLLGAYRLPYIK